MLNKKNNGLPSFEPSFFQRVQFHKKRTINLEENGQSSMDKGNFGGHRSLQFIGTVKF